jgi:hypothetical protein
MPDRTQEEMAAYIAELRERARKSQADARKDLNPLFAGMDGERAPRDFVESSFLFMRSWDADDGSRPMTWPMFWLSPDLRVAPLSHLGARTTELTAGATYRLTATVRNRGDLPVPSAKVEFYLGNPSLGFDTRFASKLGVAAGRVQAYGASEVSLDYVVPPSLSGHRCLFARVFAFSPLDVPVDDYALDPRIDRHIAQLNLNIVTSGSTLAVDWIHRRTAAERLEIVPMTAAMVRAVRMEAVTAFSLQKAALWDEVQGGLDFKVVAGEGATIETKRTETGLELLSVDRDSVSLDRQAELTKAVLQALKGREIGRGDAAKYRELFREYRAMTAQSVRTTVAFTLPDAGLKTGQAVALNVIRRSLATGEALGGIGLFLTPSAPR